MKYGMLLLILLSLLEIDCVRLIFFVFFDFVYKLYVLIWGQVYKVVVIFIVDLLILDQIYVL